MEACNADIRSWCKQDLLVLNDSKTELGISDVNLVFFSSKIRVVSRTQDRLLNYSTVDESAKPRCSYARVKGHLEPTQLKSSPLFTFSTKSLGQDSPSIHLFSKIIGSSFNTARIKLGEDSPS